MSAILVILLGVLGFRALRATATELRHIGTVLQQVGTGSFALDPPPCEIKETGALISAIQRIASELHKKREAIAELSFTDSVTKLPNRPLYFERLHYAFELAKRSTPICILLMEINDFQKPMTSWDMSLRIKSWRLRPTG